MFSTSIRCGYEFEEYRYLQAIVEALFVSVFHRPTRKLLSPLLPDLLE
jgi:hypothetical protein